MKTFALFILSVLLQSPLHAEVSPLDDTDSDRLVECAPSHSGMSIPELTIYRLRSTGYTYVRFFDIKNGQRVVRALEKADPRHVLPVHESASALVRNSVDIHYGVLFIGAPRFYLDIDMKNLPRSVHKDERLSSEFTAVLDPSVGKTQATVECSILRTDAYPH